MATLQNVGEIKTHNLDKNSEKECDFCNNKATQYSQYEFRDAAGSKVVYHCRSCRKVAIENLSGL